MGLVSVERSATALVSPNRKPARPGLFAAAGLTCCDVIFYRLTGGDAIAVMFLLQCIAHASDTSQLGLGFHQFPTHPQPIEEIDCGYKLGMGGPKLALLNVQTCCEAMA